MTVDQVMTHNPKTISPDTLTATALQIINSSEITTLMVVEGGKPVGIVHLHDLLRIGAA
jgi:arabinose-5-phosphate isomerase